MTEADKAILQHDVGRESTLKSFEPVLARGQHLDADALGDLQRDCEDIFKAGFDAACDLKNDKIAELANLGKCGDALHEGVERALEYKMDPDAKDILLETISAYEQCRGY